MTSPPFWSLPVTANQEKRRAVHEISRRLSVCQEQTDKSFGKSCKDKCKVVLVGRKRSFKGKDFPSLSACQTIPSILHQVFCPWLTLPWFKKDVDKVEQAQHKAAVMVVGCSAAVWGVSEGAVLVQPGEERHWGGLHGSSPYLQVQSRITDNDHKSEIIRLLARYKNNIFL